jgi:hypothetical protein
MTNCGRSRGRNSLFGGLLLAIVDSFFFPRTLRRQLLIFGRDNRWLTWPDSAVQATKNEPPGGQFRTCWAMSSSKPPGRDFGRQICRSAGAEPAVLRFPPGERRQSRAYTCTSTANRRACRCAAVDRDPAGFDVAHLGSSPVRQAIKSAFL